MEIQDVYLIREWAPLTNIIDRIPQLRRGLGLFPINLNLTCLDAVKEFLAIGSDAGVVFWYNRDTGVVKKLQCETSSPISCVKIVDSVDYMVAAGSLSGRVNIFQIQKERPADLNLAAPCTRPKPVNLYTIRDLHYSTITCCEWTKNGMKLYTGDARGIVVKTEFNYQQCLSKSLEILSESYEIVQISAYQKYLLVSTVYRSVLCKNEKCSEIWDVTQVGKKDRKLLVDCGGIFLKRNPKDPILICGRPGFRFWISDVEGTVLKTLLFRDAVQYGSNWKIPLLNPKSVIESRKAIISQNFRKVQLYDNKETYVVTHDGETLYILNPTTLVVEASAKGFRNILDFCVSYNEIFVLEGDRSIIRLAPTPEKPNKFVNIIFNPFLPSLPIPNELERTKATVDNAEECFDLPQFEESVFNIPIELAVESPSAAQNRRLEIFSQISDLHFEDSIKHSSVKTRGVRKTRKSQDNTALNISGGIVEIGHAIEGTTENEQINKDGNAVKEELRKPKTLKIIGKTDLIEQSISTSTNISTHSKNINEAFKQHLPDVLSRATLECEIEEKTKLLAKQLNLTEDSLDPISEEGLWTSITLTKDSIEHLLPLSASKESLSKVYPKNCTIQNAAVQTTPKKIYYEGDNYNDLITGRPFDDLCTNLRVASLIENCDNSFVSTGETSQATVSTKSELQLIPPQPTDVEIDSFLLDFRRAGDPMCKTKPPTSADSNTSTSSKWEFFN